MADRPRTNAEIMAKEVRLVGPEGKQVGVVPLKIAIDAAKELGMDLVEVAPNANPPVAKVMDYGKHVYETERAEREQRKQQRGGGQKAIRLRPKIDDHDFDTKVRHARDFLSDGHSVRLQIMFRRRELRRPEMGAKLLDRFAEEVGDLANVESRGGIEGRFITMVLAPQAKSATGSGDSGDED